MLSTVLPCTTADARPMPRRIPDIVKDGVSGLLFEKGNVHELAACVSRILTDKQLAKELSASERETAAKLYNGENNYQKLIEIYQSIE